MKDTKQKMIEDKLDLMNKKMFSLKDILVANSYAFEEGKEPTAQLRMFVKNGKFYTEILTGQKYILGEDSDMAEFIIKQNDENSINILTFKQAMPQFYQMSPNNQLSKLVLWILQKAILSTRTLKQLKQTDRNFNLQEIVSGFKNDLEKDIKNSVELFDIADLIEEL